MSERLSVTPREVKNKTDGGQQRSILDLNVFIGENVDKHTQDPRISQEHFRSDLRDIFANYSHQGEIDNLKIDIKVV